MSTPVGVRAQQASDEYAPRADAGTWASRRTGWALLLCTVAVAGGCRSAASDGAEASAQPSGAGPASAATSQPVVPIDRLAPGELAVGKETAFGLPLPRDLRVIASFGREVHARGPVLSADVEKFVRRHARVTTAELLDRKVVFDNASIPGADAKRRYQIEVSPVGIGETMLVVRDVSPKVSPPGLTEEEQWRAAGYTPDGKPLDPSKLR